MLVVLYLSYPSKRRLLSDVLLIPLRSKWKAWSPTMSSMPVFSEDYSNPELQTSSGSTRVGFYRFRPADGRPARWPRLRPS